MDSMIFPKTHISLIQKKSGKETCNRLISLSVSFFILTNIVLVAQTNETASPFKATADLVSTFVWRGSMATESPTPNFQPTLAFMKGNFEIGFWGSIDFAGSYKEVDPYISVTARHLKFVFTDYNWNLGKTNYFNYKNSQTGHRFEGAIGFTGTENIPLSISWNTMIYGLDKKLSDSTKQAFSTYIELGYSRSAANFFLGFTPWSGFYNNYGITAFDEGAGKKTFSIVNIGATVTKALKISETFSLQLKATLVINPSATYSRNDFIHLIFGITF
jgi:hypothetical protein